MDLEKKLELACREPAVEVLTRDELRQVFENYAHPKHYIGFEISGKVHIGTGLMTALKVKDLLEAGCRPTIFLADYHAWINGKLGGDLGKIQRVARGYFKQAFVSLGLDEGKVDYVLASEFYEKLGKDYWKDVLEVANNTTVARMTRCMTILGRAEKDATQTSHLIYPAMQAADIFALKVQIAHAGMDQRKVHVLAREVGEKLKKPKFAALHVKLLMGLQGPQKMGIVDDEHEHKMEDLKEGIRNALEINSKMSKSKPETCIYIHDSEEEIKKKIDRAYCPVRIFEGNPVIELAEQVLMRGGKPLKISRDKKFGGDAEFASVNELKKAYSEGKLHPADLKNAAALGLAKVLEPSRKYFEKNTQFLDFGD